MRVYLAGTICQDERVQAWREQATNRLKRHEITTVSPLRGKDFDKISKDGLTSDIPSRLFVARDLQDIRTCDAMLLVWLKTMTARQSIGTWSEMGIAMARQLPLVVYTDDPQAWKHPFVTYAAASICKDMEEAYERLIWLKPVDPQPLERDYYKP